MTLQVLIELTTFQIQACPRLLLSMSEVTSLKQGNPSGVSSSFRFQIAARVRPLPKALDEASSTEELTQL